MLFDGQSDIKSSQFHRAFDIFRKLNAEIAKQNARIEVAGFETRAAENWIRLHQGNSVHVQPIKRGVPSEQNVAWSPDRATDRQLLPLLARYCYRCHSSLSYNVFDKQAVIERAGDMVDRIHSDEVDYRMPQDRRPSADVKRQLTSLLKQLEKEVNNSN